MGLLITIGQFFLSLSILVVLHEMGHFLPAKWFNTKVEKFYLFFDPYFALFKKQIGDTEYGVGWLPLGGYVKIAGMIDESMDKEQMAGPPQPWEFRSKPAWQRLIIMLGGVTVNFVLGFFLLGMVMAIWGESYTLNSDVKYGINVDSIGEEIGMQAGDKIVSIGGKAFEEFNPGKLKGAVIFNGAKSLVVNRNGQDLTLNLTPEVLEKLQARENKGMSVFEARVPFVLGGIAKDKPADKAGFEKNDSIIGINGQTVQFYDQGKAMLAANSSKEVNITFVRNGQELTKPVTLDNCGKMGVGVQGPQRFFPKQIRHYTWGEALPKGVSDGVKFLGDQVTAFGKMFSGELKAKNSLGGFMSIGGLFGETWDWRRFWYMTAIISLILAFMNLLPIPALDGGHVVFLLYEVISGKKPSDDFMEKATVVGFVLILILLVYANGLDIVEHFFSDNANAEC